MTTGYWIVKGDKTSCGGVVKQGTEKKQLAGDYIALNGHKVSCGKHSGSYSIAGGHPGEQIEGIAVASTLYSRSTCPCRARLIPSHTWAIHGPYQENMPRTIFSSPATTEQPDHYAQAARKKTASDAHSGAATPKKRREITLTLGVFFDGTGNNAVNTDNMLKAYTAKCYQLSDPEAEGIRAKCARENFGVSGLGATSYIGYYTNVHWLNTLYTRRFLPDSHEYQHAIYIDGIGTEAGKPDSIVGQVLGISDTGVIAKTDKAVSGLVVNIREVLKQLRKNLPNYELVIKSLQFDIFGFSRGAAASRHFANRIHSEDPAIIGAIREGMTGTLFNGAPAGKIRFIGIFDTVAAVGTPVNGMNPHSANTGEVNLVLRPGVAEKVFHITAAQECRFNFALNSVKPAWPELALPGAHSDIGGGYLPLIKENLFLTRPTTDTVPLNQPGQQTRGYYQATQQLRVLDTSPAIAPVLRTNQITAENWYDDRMPPNRYGEAQKRSFAALTLRDRIVKNDWSRVVLRVMMDAAQEAGVMFDPIRETNRELHLTAELTSLCEKAIAMGKAVRSGQPGAAFNQDEMDVISSEYIHCSANWNAIVADTDRFIRGGASPSEVIGFVNRPDKNWRRTVYNMDGKHI